ncbi:MAG: DedA family protein [Aquificae bacterium]|nr:DedA family protein [Aquificota bacterium]
MEKELLDTVYGYLESYGYFAIFLITILETSVFLGMFIPGDTVVILSGFLASKDLLNLLVIIIIASTGAIIGDNIGYFIGKKLGEPFLLKYGRIFGFKKEYLNKSHEFFDRFGGMAIVLGRFTSIVRTFVPVVAGISEMNYKKFLFYNVFGAVLWACVFSVAGYVFGKNLDMLVRYIGLAGTAVIIAFLAVIGFFIVLYKNGRFKNG